MSALRTIRMLVIVLHMTLLIAVDSNTICQNFKFVVDKDVLYNHMLEGHVFKRLTVYSASQCHLMCRDDCLCVSMNYAPVFKENNCELNDASKEMEPAALKWKQGVDYYDLVRSYTVKVSISILFTLPIICLLFTHSLIYSLAVFQIFPVGWLNASRYYISTPFKNVYRVPLITILTSSFR